ncbi:MAG TPA: hypothetical protein VGV62_16110 [Xanthobacteraceae bacterium]|jgi:hypothetical protein|nr:hypothetical protein [Xanthobacteraceae bacterium]
MATMMLGQTDDSFTGIEAYIRNILNAISAESYSIIEELSIATKRETLSLAIGLITCFLLSVAAMAFVPRSTGDTAVQLGYRDRSSLPTTPQRNRKAPVRNWPSSPPPWSSYRSHSGHRATDQSFGVERDNRSSPSGNGRKRIRSGCR